MLLDKTTLGFIALFLNVVSSIPYIWLMLRGEVRPHVFSWIIWCLACTIVFAAQYSANAGPGGWTTGMGALICLFVIFLCFLQRADWSIYRSDWVAFLGALAIIPIWYVTENALVAAILGTLIDSLAYYPTFRKSYRNPHQELISMYFIANLKHIASLFAMSSYSVTTLVMPVVMLIMNSALIGMLIWRRHVLVK